MKKQLFFILCICLIVDLIDASIPIVVIGGGPAGLAAGLYGARSKLETLVIVGDNPGGQLTGSGEVENWPGIMRKQGAEIMDGFLEQVESVGATLLDDVVYDVDFSQRPFKILTHEHGTIEADSVIIATGSYPKKLGVAGEQEYWGQGVSSCAVCDCFLYDGLDVAIVGGGDSAIEEALHLAPYARKVTVFVRKPYMRAVARMQDKLLEYPDIISVVYKKEVVQVVGSDMGVIGLQVRDTESGLVDYFPVDGLFLAIGHIPNTALFKDWLQLAPDKHILLPTRSQATEIPGVFVAGDIADNCFRQAAIAAGSGVQAALEAIDFLRYSE